MNALNLTSSGTLGAAPGVELWLLDTRPLPLIDLATWSGDVEAALRRIRAVQSAISSATAPLTEAELTGHRAELTDAAADLLTLRRQLDREDMVEHLPWRDARLLLLRWRWERELRHAVLAVDADARRLQERIQALLEGARLTRYVVRAGDTLQKIAAAYLGSWEEWPRIAALNRLEPGQPAVGTVLQIPGRS